MYSSRGRRRSVACCEGHGQAYLLPRPGCHMNTRHDMRGQDQPYRYSARRQESNMHGLNPNFISLLFRCSHGALGAGWAWPWGRPALRPLSRWVQAFGVAALRITDTRLGTRRSQSHAQFANGVLFFYTHLSVSRQSRHSWVLWGQYCAPTKRTKFTRGYNIYL
jgi:hypothetical protein